jgi:hypothetical protein
VDDETGADDSALHNLLDRPWIGSGLIGFVAAIPKLSNWGCGQGLKTILTLGFTSRASKIFKN